MLNPDLKRRYDGSAHFVVFVVNDLGPCENCCAKLEDDLIRMHDWEYSAETFGVPDELLEALRGRVVRDYTAAYELLEQPHDYKPKNKRSKSRATQRKWETNSHANWEYPLQDGLGSVRAVASTTLATLESRSYDPFGLLYLRARCYSPALGGILRGFGRRLLAG